MNMRHKYTQKTEYKFTCGNCKYEWTTSYHSNIEKIECPECRYIAGADRISTVEGILNAARDLAKLPCFQIDNDLKVNEILEDK